MPTRIEALASFTNQFRLSHLENNHISTGETAVVEDEYAQELMRGGLAEILEEDVSAGSDQSEDEAESGTETSETVDTDRFDHTEFVSEDGTLTENLPKASVLAEGGITTFSDLSEVAGDFQQVKGVGPASEEKLNEAWEEIVRT